MNYVWVALIVVGVVVSGLGGQVDAMTQGAMSSTRVAIDTLIGLAGVMILWLGIARIAEEAGLIRLLSRALSPVIGLLFPRVPRDHPAMGAMLMNLSANLLGLGHAATPFGLKAMQELNRLNDEPGTATNPMITFLVLNTSGVTLVPAFMIGLRAQAGSATPGDILVPTLVATLAASVVGLTVDALIRRYTARRRVKR